MYDAYIVIRKTVYFRDQEDLDKFDAIKNKAEWLHEHLNTHIQPNGKIFIRTADVADKYSSKLVDEPTITEAEDTA